MVSQDITKLRACETRLEFKDKYIKELEEELRQSRIHIETLLRYGMPEDEHIYSKIETWLEKSREKIKLANDKYKKETEDE